MNKIQDALKNEELMFEVGRKATEEQISVLQVLKTIKHIIIYLSNI